MYAYGYYSIHETLIGGADAGAAMGAVAGADAAVAAVVVRMRLRCERILGPAAVAVAAMGAVAGADAAAAAAMGAAAAGGQRVLGWQGSGCGVSLGSCGGGNGRGNQAHQLWHLIAITGNHCLGAAIITVWLLAWDFLVFAVTVAC